jgi:hypothetical protein
MYRLILLAATVFAGVAGSITIARAEINPDLHMQMLRCNPDGTYDCGGLCDVNHPYACC